jgi:hypothetical protein
MRVALSVIGVTLGLGLSLGFSPVAQAQTQAPIVTRGNDTGGIIPWSCENEAAAHAIAAAHCAPYGKYQRISSVHRQYGDYIAFNCLWNPRQAQFALPAVPTRSACYAVARAPRVVARESRFVVHNK